MLTERQVQSDRHHQPIQNRRLGAENRESRPGSRLWKPRRSTFGAQGVHFEGLGVSLGALRVDFGSPGADFWSPGTYLELFGGHFVAIWVPPGRSWTRPGGAKEASLTPAGRREVDGEQGCNSSRPILLLPGPLKVPS